MEACHVGRFDDFGECDKFGKILSKCQMHAKGTNKVTNLKIFRQGPKFKRMSSRQGYQQSGEFDEYGEFGDISPKTKIQANEHKTRVPTKWRI